MLFIAVVALLCILALTSPRQPDLATLPPNLPCRDSRNSNLPSPRSSGCFSPLTSHLPIPRALAENAPPLHAHYTPTTPHHTTRKPSPNAKPPLLLRPNDTVSPLLSWRRKETDGYLYNERGVVDTGRDLRGCLLFAGRRIRPSLFHWSSSDALPLLCLSSVLSLRSARLRDHSDTGQYSSPPSAESQRTSARRRKLPTSTNTALLFVSTYLPVTQLILRQPSP